MLLSLVLCSDLMPLLLYLIHQLELTLLCLRLSLFTPLLLFPDLALVLDLVLDNLGVFSLELVTHLDLLIVLLPHGLLPLLFLSLILFLSPFFLPLL